MPTGARVLLRTLRPGTYPRGGSEHLRIWVAERLIEASGAANLSGATWMVYFARALGANIGRRVDLHTLPPVTGMIDLGEGCSIEPETDLSGYWIDGDVIHVGSIPIGAGASVGARSTLYPGARIGAHAEVAPGSAGTGKVTAGQRWAGSPAVKVGKAVPMLPAATVLTLVVFAGMTVVAVRLLGLGLREGYHPVRSRIGWQAWSTERLMDSARTFLLPLYASLLTPLLVAVARRQGREEHRNLDGSGPPEVHHCRGRCVPRRRHHGRGLRTRRRLAAHRARQDRQARVLGNSGITGPGRTVPKNGLVAVLSATPDKKGKSGSSWLGSPPVRLRRSATEAAASRTFDPPTRLRVARAIIETCRLIPMIVTFGIGLGVLVALEAFAGSLGFVWAALLSGLVLLVAGAVAGGIAAAAKWIVVGRIGVVEHPLWSSFVWRNEVSDAFVETVAAPWFARAATGTAVLNLWLRAMGVSIGRGVWCETYWLPEADLVTLGDGATVSRGCVVQPTCSTTEHEHGHRHPRRRRHPRPAQRGTARLGHRPRRHRRAGVSGDAWGPRARLDPLAGQPIAPELCSGRWPLSQAPLRV
ncbi:hypothetical protein RW1_006_02290 [Rhodococcus wratislaviensis NBRC 100605]|uniref:Non-ribosomal peptide synthetase n=1 Tax=Rhodococcus wratislaviensis NBRC 100605 TaxID=1219028 RepID=X0QXI1_RHOWR|nr:hypothetical protein RW1_006_02290 [Rhodococcus wratislaviensis NBRC 100605]